MALSPEQREAFLNPGGNGRGEIACESCDATENVAHSDELGMTLCGACFGRRADSQLRGATAIAPGELFPDDLYEQESNGASAAESADEVSIVTAREFSAVEEPGAAPLVGDPGEVLIPESGDVMFYGDGGASKTTLSIDLAVHLAAGEDWLDITVPKPVRVLVIEAEGPRALFRAKLRRKLEGWPDLGERLLILERPWAQFRFPEAEEVAEIVGRHKVDVLIVGPLTRVGMEELGTLQQVRDFADIVAGFRARSGRDLTIILIHHENKGGTVSGAWEGAGDTLFHAQVHARGKTTLTVQKARWSGEWHQRTLELAWTDGEGFEVAEEEERDLVEEIAAFLADKPYKTAKEIAAKEDAGGIGANVDHVKGVLEHNPERFTMRTGEDAKAVGRNSNAKVWELRTVTRASESHESHGSTQGVGINCDSGDSPYRESPRHESHPHLPISDSDLAESPESPSDLDTLEGPS